MKNKRRAIAALRRQRVQLLRALRENRIALRNI